MVKLYFKTYLFTVFQIFWIITTLSFAAYEGSWNDSQEIEEYIKKNIEKYFEDVDILREPEKKRERHALNRELEKLVLKIDAGDIKDDTIRKQVVALRRQALKSQNTSEYSISNFDSSGQNRIGSPMRIEYAGKAKSISPWAYGEYENEKGRIGKRYLKLHYDIQEGNVYVVFPVSNTLLFKQYDGLHISLSGDKAYVAFELGNDNTYERYALGEVEKDSKEFSLYFDDEKLFTPESDIQYNDIDFVRLVLVEEDSMMKQGIINIESFSLRKKEKGKDRQHLEKIIQYNVEGSVPLGENKSFIQ